MVFILILRNFWDINHLLEADDGDGGTGDHEANADDEEEVKNLILQGTLRKSPMRNLKKMNSISM
jgi:hypothetical protein